MSTSPQGFYDFLSRIDENSWVEYGFIVIAILFVTTRILKPTYLQVLGLIFAAIAIYYRIDKKRNTLEDVNTELDYQLKSLWPKVQNLHMDANLVSLFYNLRQFRKYNSEAYDNCLIAVDNMLKVVSEIEAGVYHCKENSDVVEDELYKAINHMASMIFRIPLPKMMVKKYKRALNALHIICRRHLDDVREICKNYYSAKPIDINTHFIINDGPRANDTDKQEYNPHYNLF